MGWWYQHRDINTNTLDWFKSEFGEGVIDAAEFRSTEVYLAYRRQDSKVTCIVCLVDWRPGEPANFGYKDMSEDMGPYYYNCPERILDQLSPLEELFDADSMSWDSAWKWRLMSRKYNQ